jgi:hypothetical protein
LLPRETSSRNSLESPEAELGRTHFLKIKADEVPLQYGSSAVTTRLHMALKEGLDGIHGRALHWLSSASSIDPLLDDL